MKMDRKELIGLGDASIRKALANMFAILNGDGEILTRIGDGDKVLFSPRLDCDAERSVVLFDNEDGARGAIEEILSPQDDGEYHVFKFTSIDDGGDDDEIGLDDEDLNGFDFDADDDEEDVESVEVDDEDDADAVQDANNDSDSVEDEDGEMSLDSAIEHAREVAAKMLSEDPDCSCGREHEQIAKWLEELRSMRSANGDDVDESAGKSTGDIRKVLKRNGYQLVSQKGSKQHWKKEEGDEPIVIPFGDDIFDGAKWMEIVKSRGLTTDFED